MAKTPAQNTALTRYAACAIRSRKLSAAIALKLNAICDFSRLTVPNQPGGLEAVLLQRITSADRLSDLMIRMMGDAEALRPPHHIKFYEEFLLVLELGMLPVVEASIGYRTLHATKEENLEDNRRFCLQHFYVTQPVLGMFKEIKTNKRIVALDPNADADFKKQVGALCVTMQGYMDRAAQELAMPAFRIDRKTLMKWHEEVVACIALLVIQWPFTHVVMRMEAENRKKHGEVDPVVAHAPVSDLSKRYIAYLMDCNRFLSTMHVSFSKIEADYALKAKEGLIEHLRLNLICMNESQDRAILAFAGNTWQDADLEALHHNLLLNEERLSPWSWFTAYRSSAMYGSKEEDLALNKKYCIDYVQHASDLLNRIDTLCSRTKLAPVSDTLDQFRTKIVGLRELVEKEVNWATAEIAKPVVTIPRLDLSKTYDVLADLTMRYTKEVAGALKYDPTAPAITLSQAIPVKVEKPQALPEPKGESESLQPQPVIH